MKKGFKKKVSLTPAPASSDLASSISKIQQQLVFLEKKIDILIGQSKEVPSPAKHSFKPFQRFDHSQRHSQGRPDRDFKERSFTQAVCADCKRECEVPFRPSGDRPIYCRECFSKRNQDSSRPQGAKDRRYGQGGKKTNFRRRKERF
ncbi:MAG: hypothetical protein KKH93_05100 [Candidatus Omnitrophica bacterium]|nr:hypothetical protein [Candidatus Omnitrophota bacterium]MBU2044024.1 hypothetical protein [Candidatus Omnitrophota bacterium]MBU2251151.1 hypothetical protein [Candidatus Omnitrophota bacterium]MBU2265727.1 hypothetical protein [Candidatus Omnitrophota bacterium]MBU2473928.1 hypothetical protein [Candidatus Omnitrophota bacterium]